MLSLTNEVQGIFSITRSDKIIIEIMTSNTPEMAGKILSQDTQLIDQMRNIQTKLLIMQIWGNRIATNMVSFNNARIDMASNTIILGENIYAPADFATVVEKSGKLFWDILCKNPLYAAALSSLSLPQHDILGTFFRNIVETDMKGELQELGPVMQTIRLQSLIASCGVALLILIRGWNRTECFLRINCNAMQNCKETSNW